MYIKKVLVIQLKLSIFSGDRKDRNRSRGAGRSLPPVLNSVNIKISRSIASHTTVLPSVLYFSWVLMMNMFDFYFGFDRF